MTTLSVPLKKKIISKFTKKTQDNFCFFLSESTIKVDSGVRTKKGLSFIARFFTFTCIFRLFVSCFMMSESVLFFV